MERMWNDLLLMLPVFVEGVLFFICGIYQIVTARESFLMWKIRKKYSYEKYKVKFVKAYGILDMILSVHCMLLVFYKFYTTLTGVIFISIPILLIIGIGEYIIRKRFTDNLENRQY